MTNVIYPRVNPTWGTRCKNWNQAELGVFGSRVKCKAPSGSRKRCAAKQNVVSSENRVVIKLSLEFQRTKRFLTGALLALIDLSVGFSIHISRQPENIKPGFIMIGLGFIAISAVGIWFIHTLD